MFFSAPHSCLLLQLSLSQFNIFVSFSQNIILRVPLFAFWWPETSFWRSRAHPSLQLSRAARNKCRFGKMVPSWDSSSPSQMEKSLCFSDVCSPVAQMLLLAHFPGTASQYVFAKTFKRGERGAMLMLELENDPFTRLVGGLDSKIGTRARNRNLNLSQDS